MSSKIYGKMVSADIKANQNNKALWLYLTNF